MTGGNLSVAAPGRSGTEGAAVMKDNHKTAAAGAPRSRYAELKQMLEERRREIQAEVQGKMRGVESAEADIQEELEFSLVQMKSETLNKINDALVRLDQGSYGNCFDCGEEIAEKRLRALPFAVRCKDCEEAREVAEQRERQMAARRGTSGLFLDM
jgi:DnaK suppressor protein